MSLLLVKNVLYNKDHLLSNAVVLLACGLVYAVRKRIAVKRPDHEKCIR